MRTPAPAIPRLHARALPLCVSLLLAAPLGGLGCAAGTRYPARTADAPGLELQRVVLYRNGVGYFERTGDVEGDALRIKVRKDQVDDLLKSLTVVDRRSGQALSVSMPLDPSTWGRAAMATLAPGAGSLAQVLDALRGTEVVLKTTAGRVRGRITLVEEILDEPDPDVVAAQTRAGIAPEPSGQRDVKVTLLAGAELHVVRLSKVRSVTLVDGDIALQFERSLDATAGEGMFEQVEVTVRFAPGVKTHDVAVSYVVGAPMWKPTYRVVLPESGAGQGLLQGWAVVDNTSGEDWTQVQLALTSGAPIAFRYDLHTPREVPRADLTEAGIRRQAQAMIGETSFMDAPEPASAMAADASTSADAYGGEGEPAAEELGMSGEGMGGGGYGRAAGAVAPAPMKKAESRRGAPSGVAAESAPAAAPPPAVDMDALRASTQASAKAKQVAGMTRFDLDQRVTVPDGSSTMVALVNREVEAEETFLYRPGGGGVGFDANPYRVVRFRNTTPFVLEPGPISIYAGGSFVGEGLSETVGAGVSATIPFAVEPGILVTSTSSYSGDEMKLVRVVRGVLEVKTYSQRSTTWSVQAQPGVLDGERKSAAAKVLVRHPKAGWNYELRTRPPGTEDLPDAYLIPVAIDPKSREGKLDVVEQTPSSTSISIWDGRALPLLEGLLAAGSLDAASRAALEPVVGKRQAIGKIDTEVEGLKRQQAELDDRADQTRRNLEAIKKDPGAGGLRGRLSQRLDEFTRAADQLGRKVVELESKRLELKIELEDLLQGLQLDDLPGAKEPSAPTPAPMPATKGR
jgi:hypothetical protein